MSIHKLLQASIGGGEFVRGANFKRFAPRKERSARWSLSARRQTCTWQHFWRHDLATKNASFSKEKGRKNILIVSAHFPRFTFCKCPRGKNLAIWSSERADRRRSVDCRIHDSLWGLPPASKESCWLTVPVSILFAVKRMSVPFRRLRKQLWICTTI